MTDIDVGKKWGLPLTTIKSHRLRIMGLDRRPSYGYKTFVRSDRLKNTIHQDMIVREEVQVGEEKLKLSIKRKQRILGLNNKQFLSWLSRPTGTRWVEELMENCFVSMPLTEVNLSNIIKPSLHA